MSKIFFSLLIFFLLVAGMSFLFSKWWKSRVSQLTISPVASPSPSIRSSKLSSLLSKMRPLEVDEKTIELNSNKAGVSGLVRYLEEKEGVSFTVFILPENQLNEALYLWLANDIGFEKLGILEEGKGGLLISGFLSNSQLPAEFKISSLESREKSDSPVLTGTLTRTK